MSEKDKKNARNQALEKCYRNVINRFRNSEYEPQAFVIECLKAGTVAASDAEALVSYLKSNTISRAFSLANLSTSNSFRLALHETADADDETEKEQHDTQLFVIQLDPKLLPFSEEIHNHLEPFAHKIAEIACQTYANNADMKGHKKDSSKSRDILSSVLDMLPSDATCH